MSIRKWIIESRQITGHLDLTEPQPESVFGSRAITGLTDDQIAKTIYRLLPDVILTGDNIAFWPKLIDKRWIARPKTW